MKIQQMIRVLESVLAEKGDVEFVILDYDTDALIEVDRTGMTDDGRFAVYGDWSVSSPYGRIVGTLYERGAVNVELIERDAKPRGRLDKSLWDDDGEIKIVSVKLIDKVEEPGSNLWNAEVVGSGSWLVEFDREGWIVRIEMDEEE